MSVWYCIPSARPPAEAEKCLSKWRERGYKIALWRDIPVDAAAMKAERSWVENSGMDVTFGPYPGYARAVNEIVRLVLAEDLTCDWVVTGGDDVSPDPNLTADGIASQCSEHFGSVEWGPNVRVFAGINNLNMASFGVMQPTGDRWGENDPGAKQRWPNAPAQIDRICGSPWMGREFCERINQGNGPLWHEYPHNWVDEELQNVALKYECFQQRRDLTHYHDHCCRNGGPWAPHLQHVSADYTRMKPLFEARKRMGFPGSEPL